MTAMPDAINCQAGSQCVISACMYYEQKTGTIKPSIAFILTMLGSMSGPSETMYEIETRS
jgi:hypothetical protein